MSGSAYIKQVEGGQIPPWIYAESATSSQGADWNNVGGLTTSDESALQKGQDWLFGGHWTGGGQSGSGTSGTPFTQTWTFFLIVIVVGAVVVMKEL